MGSLEEFADPSRLYGAARRARIALDAARDQIARHIGGRAEEIVFTSGGTESCNLAISGGALAAAAARRPKRILVSAIEHTAVLEAARRLDGFETVELPCSSTVKRENILGIACKYTARCPEVVVVFVR